MKLLYSATAPINAPLADVLPLIDGDFALDVMVPPAARAHVDVDHRPGVLGFQGHWWYRGELEATATPTGTDLTYRVYNIAKRGSAWAVPLANKLFIGYDQTVRAGVTGVAAAIERHLAT
ncbi:hypothetical protein [Dactylosporangium sp. CS-033363]|uniref:hypothetical protein n=1 Tax=Dactylosporangium sp. CS-033363 TaxID=3239935 RepID=UPI003D8EE061